MKNALIYIGKGAFQAPIPARDLSEEEVKAFGKQALLKTGLYQEPPVEKKLPEPASKKSDKEN